MGNDRFPSCLVLLAFLAVSVRNVASQSITVTEREDEQKVIVSFGVKQDRVSDLINVGNGFYLQRSPDRVHGVVERTASGSKFYPLPKSSVAEYLRLRGTDNQYRWPPIRTANDYERHEMIGPYQVEDNLLWFGNHYYDGEGATGVGAFGYFDMKTRRYRRFSPAEVAHWEISALLVEPEAVWLGLDHNGEDISNSPGGLVRWNRNNHHIQRYPLEFVVDRIQRDKKDASVLRLATRGDYALFRDGDIQRFHVQKSSAKKETVVRITRFPPPPSLY